MDKRGLPLAWTKHTRDSKEKEAVENSIRASVTIRERLQVIIDEQLQLLDTHEFNSMDFQDVAWPYKQAFRNGRRASLTYIKELLSFGPRNEHTV